MLGIFVHPIDVQNEGLQPVFQNLESIGVTDICITSRVGRLADADKGVRFPPLHIDGYRRKLARPLWGKREQRIEFFNAYKPNLSLYTNATYQPLSTPVPPELDTSVPYQMIAEAHKRGMHVHMLIQPFLPPNIRPQDQPIYIDGSLPQPPFIARNACLNSPTVEKYARALVQDTLDHFQVDGLFTDWAEYGAYRLQDNFTCFCANCERQASKQGFDWGQIQHDVAQMWDWLHKLSERDLARSIRLWQNPSDLLALLTRYPGWLQFFQFKANTVTNFYRQVRHLIESFTLQEIQLSARGWPPPWNRSSGMDYSALANICHTVTPKLFTFDYSVLPRWYGEVLRTWNPDLTQSAILNALLVWMNLPDDVSPRTFEKYQIPAPHEMHPASIEAYHLRVDEVLDQVNGRAAVCPFAHAYLPEPQWLQMVRMLSKSRVDGMWVQMYGYLSEQKAEILKENWRSH